jgi:hypothetical protein
MCVEHVGGGFERYGVVAQVARRQGDLGFGDPAARTRDGLRGSEASRRAPNKGPTAGEVSQLGHRDAPKREGRRIVAQGHALQRAERVSAREGATGGGDQGVHRNPAKLVTPPKRAIAPTMALDPAVATRLATTATPRQAKRR